MSLEKTLVILKPSTVQRGLIGEITHRFERKGLRLAGMKMMQLTEDLLNEHYAHLAIQVVRSMTGATNGRVAVPGTIRGDYCVSSQENIIHTSDSPKTAIEEIERFFKPEELFEYERAVIDFVYYPDEYKLT